MKSDENIRLRRENWEKNCLSPLACLSADSRGRERKEDSCDMRTVFQRDRDRILHCKSFRRLQHKTQVFLDPDGDHYRTRLTHTLEVAQISRSISRALMLNEDLTEAIALGHDLGHTPFGHCGERVLNSVAPGGFEHNRQSLRVVDKLENNGRGLNLTWEVRDGIVNHRSACHPQTAEGRVVRLSDKIAYVNHDIDDALRAGILREEDIPKEYTSLLGNTVRERINWLIHDVVSASLEKGDVAQSSLGNEALYGLRHFLNEHVYRNSLAKMEEPKAEKMIGILYETYMDSPDLMPEEYSGHMESLDSESQTAGVLSSSEGYDMTSDSSDNSRSRIVCDYIAGMTDRYAVKCFEDIYVPKSWGHM